MTAPDAVPDAMAGEVPDGTPDDPIAVRRLASLRDAIAQVDAALLVLAADRVRLARAAAAAKRALGRPVHDPAQEAAVLDRAAAWAADAALPPDGARALAAALVALSRRAQEEDAAADAAPDASDQRRP